MSSPFRETLLCVALAWVGLSLPMSLRSPIPAIYCVLLGCFVLLWLLVRAVQDLTRPPH